MAHYKNSKTERISVTMTNSNKTFFSLISDDDKKSKFCKTNLAEVFMRYGIYVAFSEFIKIDLSNFRQSIIDLRRITNGHHFERIIEGVINQDKMKGGKKEDEP